MPYVDRVHRVQIGPGRVFLMHAAGIPGTETEYPFSADASGKYAVIGDAIVYPLPPGRYRAEMLTHLKLRTATSVGEYVVLVRFRLQGESAVAAD